LFPRELGAHHAGRRSEWLGAQLRQAAGDHRDHSRRRLRRLRTGKPQAGAGMSEAGRVCPLRYRYGAEALAAASELAAETLYVVGGLYGNPFALDAVEALAAMEPGPVRIVFNGDFNW